MSKTLLQVLDRAATSGLVLCFVALAGFVAGAALTAAGYQADLAGATAAAWVQAIGALLAIYAAWRIARRQDEAREAQARDDRARDAARAEAVALAVAFRIIPTLVSLRSRFASIRVLLDQELFWIDWADAPIPDREFARITVGDREILRGIADRLHDLPGRAGLTALHAIGLVDIYEDQIRNWRIDAIGITVEMLKGFAHQAEQAVDQAFNAAVEYRVDATLRAAGEAGGIAGMMEH